MQNRKPHSQKAPQTGHSIFGTILFSLLAVLAMEFPLLTFAVHVTRLGPQLNQNAEDILAMQVDNRSRYLQSIFHDAQELTSLSDAINGLTQQLLDEGEISLSTLDSSSDAAYPLLEAAAPELISTLRIKSVTGVFLILNTHDLDKRKQDSLMPAIYLRDLDPDAAPSQRNADLTFVRAPAQLVQSLSIATDNSWSPTIRYRALGNRGFLYPPFQAAYKDGASLAASDYGHWTSRSYPMPGDTHEAIAYSQPLILPDGTVYGVIGVELLADYQFAELGEGPQHVENGMTCDGEGFVRLLRFTRGGQLLVSTYSPAYDKWNYYPEYVDSLVYDLDLIETPLSIRTTDFAVGLDIFLSLIHI